MSQFEYASCLLISALCKLLYKSSFAEKRRQHKKTQQYSLVKNDDVMDLIVVFCILFVSMLVLYCFCVVTEFSVNKDSYNTSINSNKTKTTTKSVISE